MSILLGDLHSVRFYPDSRADALNDKFMLRLGMTNRYQPARLAISRSLAIDSAPPRVRNKSSRTITADTLFGSGEHLFIWVALIIENNSKTESNTEIDKTKLVDLVARHWLRGVKLLDKEWKKSDQEFAKFVQRLVKVAEIPIRSPSSGTHQPVDFPTSNGSSSHGKIAVPIGEVSEEISTKEKIKWNLNGPGGSPHSAIMGGVGSGKTRTAVAMLGDIHNQAPSVPLIAFDFKGDLGSGDNAHQIDELFGARTISPPRESIPLDMLVLDSTDKIGISSSALRFREAFANLKGSRLGDRQREAIYEAAQRALETQSPCKLQHVSDALINVYQEKEMKEDGAVSTMRELCQFPLFNPELDPASFFKQSWLINLPQNVPEDSRKIVVNLVLNALDQYLNSLGDSSRDEDGVRDLRVLCMVDEAHQILRGKLPALSNLIRMSRSKGGAIMLISQSPDDFSSVDDDFLNEMGLVVAFGSNASSRQVNRIFGKSANLSNLKTFQCFVKRSEDQAGRKIQAWPEVK